MFVTGSDLTATYARTRRVLTANRPSIWERRWLFRRQHLTWPDLTFSSVKCVLRLVSRAFNHVGSHTSETWTWTDPGMASNDCWLIGIYINVRKLCAVTNRAHYIHIYRYYYWRQPTTQNMLDILIYWLLQNLTSTTMKMIQWEVFCLHTVAEPEVLESLDEIDAIIYP